MESSSCFPKTNPKGRHRTSPATSCARTRADSVRQPRAVTRRARCYSAAASRRSTSSSAELFPAPTSTCSGDGSESHSGGHIGKLWFQIAVSNVSSSSEIFSSVPQSEQRIFVEQNNTEVGRRGHLSATDSCGGTKTKARCQERKSLRLTRAR